MEPGGRVTLDIRLLGPREVKLPILSIVAVEAGLPPWCRDLVRE